MEDKFLAKLEELKQKGVYGISIWFGERVGCDDMDVPTAERSLKVIFYPVGCLGEAKGFFKTTVGKFLEHDLKNPRKISNPPKEEEIKEDGFYMWGTDRGIDEIIKRWSA